jgi:hypothetical protein
LPILPVKPLPSADSGRLLIRLHHSCRTDVERYGIARIVNNENGRSLYTLVLGHDDDDAIFIPFDIRRELGAKLGEPLNYSIEAAGRVGRLRWYVESPDPAVSIPAWLAVIGLALAVLGIVLAIPSVLSISG